MTARFPVVLAAALAAAGCSMTPYRIAPVSGRVVIDGKPGAGVHIEFMPMGSEKNNNPGPGSIGMTDADGRFVMKVIYPAGNGAVVGRHKVQIHLREAALDDETPTAKRPRQLPAKYNSATTLVFEVPPGGTDQANFDVTTR